jgi:hypothetical protein
VARATSRETLRRVLMLGLRRGRKGRERVWRMTMRRVRSKKR